MNTKGKVFKYPDNVDTDVIIPARYLNTSDAKELAKHCMEDIDAEYVNKVQPGDIMVAGWNFGCGSSREHAPLVIKTCGTGCVIAKSFARIFYRNSINIGLAILECPEAAEEIAAHDRVSVDFDIYFQGIKQGSINPAFIIDRRKPVLPEIVSSATDNFSRSSIELNFKCKL